MLKEICFDTIFNLSDKDSMEFIWEYFPHMIQDKFNQPIKTPLQFVYYSNNATVLKKIWHCPNPEKYKSSVTLDQIKSILLNSMPDITKIPLGLLDLMDDC